MDFQSTMGSTATSSTTSSIASRRPPKTKPKKRKLIVEEQPKIERELDKSKKEYSNRPSLRIVVTKWISTAIFGSLLLACLTLSKVSVLALSHRLSEKVGQGQQSVPKKQLFVILFIILLGPNMVSFVRSVFAGLFRKDIPWPSMKGFILATVVSLLESAGLCLFVFKVPEVVTTKPYLLVLLMHTVFVVPVFTYIIDVSKSGPRKGNMALFIMAVIFEVVGVGSTFYLVYKESSGNYEELGYVLGSVLCLSIAWSPIVQRNLIKSTNKPMKIEDADLSGIQQNQMPESYSLDPEQTRGSHSAPSYSFSGATSQSQLTESFHMRHLLAGHVQEDPDTTDRLKQYTENNPPTWKLTIYMSFLKIAFTIALSLGMFKYFFEYELNEFKDGWKDWGELKEKEIYYFIANMVAGTLGYVFGYIACTTCMQRFGFAAPLLASTPLTIALLLTQCDLYTTPIASYCTLDFDKDMEKYICIVGIACLCLAQICCFGWLLFQSQFIVLLKEVQLYWTPMFNTVLLEQWLILVRKNEVNDKDFEDPNEKLRNSRVVICTTMYREVDYEMRQLLQSIQRINLAQSEGQRSFEAHVFFDGAVKDRKPQEFVLQLVSLAEETLGVQADKCTKNMTPYGMTISWKLENGEDKRFMLFVVHLKDNSKVKNKKRWSQVMYMSYVMDYLMIASNDPVEMETYILTTDADVRFTPNSVEALLDLMTRDPSVGAVCARTHPLGNGPLVWYQVFEYAIGHWFQKAAEHVIGSVLCSPGCFSVYRCSALKDILPRYASNVEHAFDFLTMDMGEDRWLCTLMVQSGWRIEYCAAAENSTHCPEEFDEFYKQRRRWVASTLANIMLLLREWHIVAKLNHRVSFLFLMYQAILLFSTLIGPSSVMLVVSGGLVYGWNIDPLTSLIIQVLITVALTLTCLFCSSNTQLNFCKLVTFAYAVVMTAVAVGTAVQIMQGEGISNTINISTTTLYLATITGIFIVTGISDTINISTTTLYLATITGIFIVTGILHLSEFVYLLHGVWFLLCLPSGYLVLMIYSVCNITDRSWGTREVKEKSVVSRKKSWQDRFEEVFKQIFFCCFKKQVATASVSVQTDHSKKRTNSTDQSDFHVTIDHRKSSVNTDERTAGMTSITESSFDFIDGRDVDDDDSGRDIDDDDSEDDEVRLVPKDVKEWLPIEMKGYAKNFKEAGFDNTMLIAGMTEKELKDVGVKKKGLRRRLMEEIKLLPDFEIQADVPENVEKWLKIVGLSQYSKVFKREQIYTAKSMEILKTFSRAELEKELNITKQGHIKRLLYAIGKLRNPTERERKLIEVQKAIDGVQENYLSNVSPEEHDFWDDLRTKRLLPQSTVFGSEEELKNKLGDLRNAWLMVFAVSNTLWLFLIETLANKGELLATYGSNPVGLLVLVMFSLVLVIQFLAMILHRMATLIHFLARAPYKFGDTFNTSWAFNEKDQRMNLSPDDRDAMAARERAKRAADYRIKHPKKRRDHVIKEEKSANQNTQEEKIPFAHVNAAYNA